MCVRHAVDRQIVHRADRDAHGAGAVDTVAVGRNHCQGVCAVVVAVAPARGAAIGSDADVEEA